MGYIAIILWGLLVTWISGWFVIELTKPNPDKDVKYAQNLRDDLAMYLERIEHLKEVLGGDLSAGERNAHERNLRAQENRRDWILRKIAVEQRRLVKEAPDHVRVAFERILAQPAGSRPSPQAQPLVPLYKPQGCPGDAVACRFRWIEHWVNVYSGYEQYRNIMTNSCLTTIPAMYPNAPLTVLLQRLWKIMDTRNEYRYGTHPVGCPLHAKVLPIHYMRKFTSLAVYADWEAKRTEVSHLCHVKMCHKDEDIVLESHGANMDRNQCVVLAKDLLRRGLPVPVFCQRHDPPCKLQQALVDNESIVLNEVLMLRGKEYGELSVAEKGYWAAVSTSLAERRPIASFR